MAVVSTATPPPWSVALFASTRVYDRAEFVLVSATPPPYGAVFPTTTEEVKVESKDTVTAPPPAKSLNTVLLTNTDDVPVLFPLKSKAPPPHDVPELTSGTCRDTEFPLNEHWDTRVLEAANMAPPPHELPELKSIAPIPGCNTEFPMNMQLTTRNGPDETKIAPPPLNELPEPDNTF